MTEEKTKHTSKLTAAIFPHITYCESTGGEGTKNYGTTNPILRKCPTCGKPKGTGRGKCNFTVKY